MPRNWAASRFISARRYDPASTDTLAPYVTVNAHLTLVDVPKGLTVSFKVYNLGSTTYYEPSVAEDSHPIARIPHPGPQLQLRLSYLF